MKKRNRVFSHTRATLRRPRTSVVGTVRIAAVDPDLAGADEALLALFASSLKRSIGEAALTRKKQTS